MNINNDFNKTELKSIDEISHSTVHTDNTFARTLRPIDAGHALSSAEITLFYLALAHIERTDKRFTEIVLTPKQISEYLRINLDGSNRKKWIERFEKLPLKGCRFKIGSETTTATYFSFCRYDTKNHTYSYALNPLFEEALLNLTDTGHNIFKYGWQLVDNDATRILYLPLNSIRNLHRNKIYYSEETLMAMTGYKRIRKNFGSQVLKKAIIDINMKTPLDVEVTPVKDGNEICGYVFEVGTKPKYIIERMGINKIRVTDENEIELYLDSMKGSERRLSDIDRENPIKKAVQLRNLHDAFPPNTLYDAPTHKK